jgi:hypothetical protein
MFSREGYIGCIRSFPSMGNVGRVVSMPEGVVSMLLFARLGRIEKETAKWELRERREAR